MKQYILTIAIIGVLCGGWLCGCDQSTIRSTTENTSLRSVYNRAQDLQARGKYQQAMQLYMEVEEPARLSGDALLMGDIYSRIGDLHTLYYDYPQALASFYRAYDAYRFYNDAEAQNLTLFAIAQCYLATGKKTDAEMLYILIYNWALLNDNNPLMQRCEEQIAMCDRMFDNLETLRQMSYPIPEQKADTLNLNIKDALVPMLYSDLRFDANHNGYPHRDFQQMRPDTVVYNPMNSIQIEYLRRLSDMRMAQLEQKQTINLLTTAIGCVLILLLVMIIIYQRRLRKAMVDNYMVEVQSLQQRLHSSESQISVMNDKVRHSSTSAAQMAEQINSLFKSQFSLLDSLVNTYYETRDINHDKEAIYKQVKGEIAKLSSPKRVAELEAIINRHRNNVIADIRTKYPSLSEQNITLLCYILAGFSAKSIGILLDCSIANVHTKRSRLKHQLMEMDAASGEKFSEILG